MARAMTVSTPPIFKLRHYPQRNLIALSARNLCYHAPMQMRLALALAVILFPTVALAVITGPARVIDGDTIEIQDQRIRLHGIDAPERGQTCLLQGRRYPCGVDATETLRKLVREKEVTCEATDRDRYGRTVALCVILGGIELGQTMVRLGWALAYRRFSLDYVHEEEEARAKKLGIWRGQFRPPWEWRRERR